MPAVLVWTGLLACTVACLKLNMGNNEAVEVVGKDGVPMMKTMFLMEAQMEQDSLEVGLFVAWAVLVCCLGIMSGCLV
jgi:hypothetical protein